MGWLHAVIDVPAEHQDVAAEFWAATLGWPLGGPWAGRPELASFEPADGAPYVHLQRVDAAPRVHLDIEAERPEDTVRAALGAGAGQVAVHEEWTTLASPGGLPFCVVRREAQQAQAPGPVAWPDGHRSRMVQVCIDSPRAAHDREVAFWRVLLGERWEPQTAPEFTAKWHDDAGSPLQLLFQRLDEPAGPVRAHLDHGADDVAAEVARLLDLGATDVGAGRGRWHVLRDPAGLPFCVTGNSPESTQRRDLS